MSRKIEYDEGQHQELQATLQKLQASFDDLIKEFNSVKKTVNGDFKGESAEALKSALEAKVAQLTKEKDDWAIVITNAETLEQEIKNADNKVARAVDVANSSNILGSGGVW